jgi:tetratricopeptide (TPR) repeat protein
MVRSQEWLALLKSTDPFESPESSSLRAHRGTPTQPRAAKELQTVNQLLSLLLAVPLSAALPLSAQADLHQGLETAAELCSQGRFEAGIALARPILESPALNTTERARGWIVIGSAYQHLGKIQEAMTADENALRILHNDDNAPDYALALNLLGTLFRDMNQFDEASQLELRALQADRKIGNHYGMATDCLILADLELALRHTDRAQEWLDKAAEESRAALSLSDDFQALLSSTQASLSEAKGQMATAVAGYEKEIDYLKHSHGDESPQVGWAYMLLGKAFLKSRNVSDALESMRRGRSLLMQTVGIHNPQYLAAQVEYAEALKSAGMRAEAARTKAEAENELRSILKEQCWQCRITVMALR